MGYMFNGSKQCHTMRVGCPSKPCLPTAYFLGRLLEAPQGKGLVSERGVYHVDQQISDRHVCTVMPQLVGDRAGWALNSRGQNRWNIVGSQGCFFQSPILSRPLASRGFSLSYVAGGADYGS